MNEYKLLKCPFCGSEPVMKRYRESFFISCISKDCLVHPETIFYNEELKAVIAWNGRKEP